MKNSLTIYNGVSLRASVVIYHKVPETDFSCPSTSDQLL